MLRRRLTPAAVLAASVAAALLPAAPAAAVKRPGNVVRVVDGDTVRVRVAGITRTYELAGVVAPEGGACFASEAASRLRRLLPRGARVSVDRRPGTRSAWIFRGFRLINVSVIESGHAKAGSIGGARGEDLRLAQADAQDAQLGLWSRCAAGPAPPPPGPTPTPAPAPGPAPPPQQQQPIQGEEAKTILRSLMVHQFFEHTGTASGGGSSVSGRDQWGFCNQRYGYYSFSSSSFGSSETQEGGTWTILEAIATPDRRGAGGRIQVTADSGNQRIVQVEIYQDADDFIDNLRFTRQEPFDCSNAAGG